jgi:hypothetical protein
MTRKQLQSLISAGVFSAALLTGVAYADDAPAAANAPAPAASGSTTDQQAAASGTDQSTPANKDQSNTQDSKAKTSDSKGPAPHGCAGASGCSSDSK